MIKTYYYHEGHEDNEEKRMNKFILILITSDF